MAESKRAQAEEKYELPIPPFEAEAYVRKETLAARATIVLALYGLLLGQVGAILSLLLRNNVASLGVFFFGLTAVKALMDVTGVDRASWDRKAWAGNILLLFFTWLASWIIFQNFPFVG